MKKVLALALVASSALSFAAERNVYDIQYLPKAGTVFGLTDFAAVNGKASGDQFDIDLSGTSIEQVVGYSLTDRLAFALLMDYTNLKQEVNFSELVSNEDYDSKVAGLSDPTLQAKFRVLEDVLILDVVAGFTYSTADATNHDDKKNNKQGGHQSTLGLQVGQKADSFQWTVLAGFERNEQATTRSKDDGKTRDDAYNTWTLIGASLVKVAEKSFIRGELGFNFANEHDDNRDDTNASATRGFLSAEYQHLVTNDVLLRAGVARNWIDTAAFDDYYFWTFNAGATYQF